MSLVAKRRHRHGAFIFTLAALIALLHAAAYEYSLYFSVSWFDTFMHVLGGTLVGSVIGWWISFEIPIGIRHRIPRFLTIVVVVGMVAVLWEVFEWSVGITRFPHAWPDTIADVIAGLVGACIAYGIYRK